MIQPNPFRGGHSKLLGCRNSINSFQALRKLAVAGSAALLTAALLAPSAQAQTIRFRTPQVHITVPINSGRSTLVTNLVTIANLGGNPVDLSLTGFPIGSSLPPGVTASLTDTNGNALLSTTITTNLWLTLNTTNVAEGVYTLSLNGVGTTTNSTLYTNNILLTLQAGFLWNGATNALVNGTGNWSDAAQWLGGGVPGPSDDVIFTDVGGQTNAVYTNPGVITNAPLVNSIVDQDTTIGSLRFTQTNSATRYHTIQINPGKTLSITGTNGLRVMRDYVSAYAGIANQPVTVTILGTNASLVVSNKDASVALLADNNTTTALSYLDLSGLDNFAADVNRIGLGDYQLWPNFDNLSTGNSYNGIPRNFATGLSLARTNVVRATYVDPDNFTNSVKRDYSLTLGNNEQGGTSTNPQYTINFGITNAFFLDSICFAHGSMSSLAQFPPAFATNFSCVAYFRGTNGGRMSVWAASDLGQGTAGQGSGSNDKTTMNFSRGTVDALVDRLYLSRDRLNTLDGANAQSTMILAQGIFDVNTAILGYQTEVGHTNVSYCQGTLVVSNTAVFKANTTLELGYTTEAATNTAPTSQNNRGTLNIGPGGTVMANMIEVGGLTKLSTANAINLNGGGANLIVSNTIAGPDQALTTLNFGGNSTLTLHIDGNHTGPYVYVTNLTTSGGNNAIEIASVQNLNLPAQVPLISYVSGTPSLGARFPVGYTGALIPVAGGYDVSITTHTPQNLVWRGTTADWDTTSLNWYDQDTGTMTNFVNGDFVTFDDTPGYPTSINLAAAVIPNGITMTNSALNYTFNAGVGSIQGSAVLNKWGTGTLQVDGATTLAVNINQGSLTGGGSVGAVSLASGTTMTFTGPINGGVDCAGTANSAGPISGTVSVLTGGILTNAAFGSINGPLNFSSGSLLYNAGNMMNIGTPTVVSNATLINAGTISGTSMGVSGTLVDEGTGSFTFDLAITINSGGTFIPGGDGIGTTSVYGSGTSAANGRVILATGSTNVFKVDAANAQPNTKLLTAHMSFGPNQNAKSVNGGTIQVVNIGSTPFSAGQSFKMFGNVFNDLDVLDAGLNTTNSYSVMDPPSPGPGLAWDLSNLIPGGYIGVMSVATNPVSLGFLPAFGTAVFTNISGTTTNYVTNSVLVAQFQWPTNYVGWRLQQQQNPLSVGLSTNWSDLWTSFTNQLVITNVITTNAATAATFYRMVYP